MKEFVLHVTKAENGYVIKLSPPFNTPGSTLPYQVWIVSENDKLHEVIAQAIVSAKLEMPSNAPEQVKSKQLGLFDIKNDYDKYIEEKLRNTFPSKYLTTNVSSTTTSST